MIRKWVEEVIVKEGTVTRRIVNNSNKIDWTKTQQFCLCFVSFSFREIFLFLYNVSATSLAGVDRGA